MKEGEKKGVWALALEYFLAAPILGIPCYTTIPVWADSEGIAVAGLVLVAAFYGSLAFYQLKRTRISGTGESTNIYVVLGVIFTILSLLSIVFFLRSAPSIPPDYDSQGTASPTTIRGMILIFSSFAFGFSLGFAALFWGYARLEFAASV